jgi:hypothetical protein
MHTRQLAAEYTREAATRFEGAVSARLMTASVNYLQESEVARQLLETVTPWSKAPTPSQVEEAPVKVGVDVVPTEPHRGTTLASSLEPVMHTLGQTGWTPARIQGVLGHVFHF